MDCYDCEYAIFDYEEYYGGYRDGATILYFGTRQHLRSTRDEGEEEL